ncbi:hypothetical protein EYC84_012104 [Monilinia fructicola]|uniref:Uncharacterized protein n=1 Tax=Monilinia fructicola TaxID=38448 RepID=A0A5M9J9X8_MONFR|nr:hypothetical protein EYC84_012104 [Monilinia fructicola]
MGDQIFQKPCCKSFHIRYISSFIHSLLLFIQLLHDCQIFFYCRGLSYLIFFGGRHTKITFKLVSYHMKLFLMTLFDGLF